jgi:hypothetical protein
MHGIGVSAEVTAGSADELAVAEEVSVAEEGSVDGDIVVAEEAPDPASSAEAALTADTPPDRIRDDDLPEDTR